MKGYNKRWEGNSREKMFWSGVEGGGGARSCEKSLHVLAKEAAGRLCGKDWECKSI